MSEKFAIPEKVKFEEAMDKLETLSESLSRENVPLDEAIAVYEEGLAYYERCKAILEDANRRILVIEEGMERER
ncbi:MAG: exodeoxyribonuclease VII small subunit [Clostridiales Family XIII bacterium]|jgi:exodeoxyribonuclease VII small subunit|nr:exodeoxyribonuclease VII small subunit [Clostridiales Family XIII bacterium]